MAEHAPTAAPRIYTTDYAVFGSATFTGPPGYTRRMGLCLVRKTGTHCDTVADCAQIPIPLGGFRYCVAAKSVGRKNCWIKPGPNAKFCAGSPANGGIPVAPGTYLNGAFFQNNSTNLSGTSFVNARLNNLQPNKANQWTFSGADFTGANSDFNPGHTCAGHFELKN